MNVKKVEGAFGVGQESESDYYSSADIKTPNKLKAIYLGLGLFTIGLNALLYPRITKLARRVGLKGFWPINFTAVCPMIILNSSIFGIGMGIHMNYKFRSKCEMRLAQSKR